MDSWNRQMVSESMNATRCAVLKVNAQRWSCQILQVNFIDFPIVPRLGYRKMLAKQNHVFNVWGHHIFKCLWILHCVICVVEAEVVRLSHVSRLNDQRGWPSTMLNLDNDIVLTVTQTKSSIQNQLYESVRLGTKPKGHFTWHMVTTKSHLIFSRSESAKILAVLHDFYHHMV